MCPLSKVDDSSRRKGYKGLPKKKLSCHFPSTAAIYEVTHTTTPQIVWQMDVNGQFAYRANRLPSLYPGVQW